MSADGAVRAMVGGRDTTVTGAFNRATQARARPDRPSSRSSMPRAGTGLQPRRPWWTSPTPRHSRLGPLVPGELHPRAFHGRVTLTEALRDSAQHAGREGLRSVGRDLVRKVASRFRHRKRSGRRPGAGARRVRKHAAGDDGRLCRHPQRRLVGHALRADRAALLGEDDAPDGARRRHRRAGDPRGRGARS